MRFSPSAVATFRGCPRKWAWRAVSGIEGVSTAAAELGKKVHDELEKYLNGGQLDFSTEVGYIAASGIHHLPRPGTPGLKTEGDFFFQGPWEHQYSGRIDFSVSPVSVPVGSVPVGSVPVGSVPVGSVPAVPVGTPVCAPVVGDHKTTRDFRWKKTEQQLLDDEQCIIYATKYFIENPNQTEVELRWVYYSTGSTKKSAVTSIRINHEHTYRGLEKIEATAREMAATYAYLTSEDVAARYPIEQRPLALPLTDQMKSFCGEYGGCQHRCRCSDIDSFKELLSYAEKDRKRRLQFAQPGHEQPNTNSNQGQNMGIMDQISRQQQPSNGAPPPNANGVAGPAQAYAQPPQQYQPPPQQLQAPQYAQPPQQPQQPQYAPQPPQAPAPALLAKIGLNRSMPVPQAPQGAPEAQPQYPSQQQPPQQQYAQPPQQAPQQYAQPPQPQQYAPPPQAPPQAPPQYAQPPQEVHAVQPGQINPPESALPPAPPVESGKGKKKKAAAAEAQAQAAQVQAVQAQAVQPPYAPQAPPQYAQPPQAPQYAPQAPPQYAPPQAPQQAFASPPPGQPGAAAPQVPAFTSSAVAPQLANKTIGTLFINCRPSYSGSNTAYPIVDADIFIQAAKARIAADGFADYRYIDYGKGPGMLAVATSAEVDRAAAVVGVPDAVHLDASTPEGQIVAFELAARARVVVR